MATAEGKEVTLPSACCVRPRAGGCVSGLLGCFIGPSSMRRGPAVAWQRPCPYPTVAGVCAASEQWAHSDFLISLLRPMFEGLCVPKWSPHDTVWGFSCSGCLAVHKLGVSVTPVWPGHLQINSRGVRGFKEKQESNKKAKKGHIQERRCLGLQ